MPPTSLLTTKFLRIKFCVLTIALGVGLGLAADAGLWDAE